MVSDRKRYAQADRVRLREGARADYRMRVGERGTGERVAADGRTWIVRTVTRDADGQWSHVLMPPRGAEPAGIVGAVYGLDLEPAT